MTPLELLRCIGAFAVGHTGRTLADHLQGTHDLLRQRGYAAEICLGGLMHSVYGTNVFLHSCLSAAERPQVRVVIGERAEELAWLFCTVERPWTFEAALAAEPLPTATLATRDGEPVVVDRRTLLDLCAIEAANLLEQGALDRCARLRAFWLTDAALQPGD